MDIARYSKDEFKKVMGELVKYEEFVTELSVNKSIRGGKLPARVYTIVIMEPDAIDLKEIEKLKKQQKTPNITVGNKGQPQETGVPKK